MTKKLTAPHPSYLYLLIGEDTEIYTFDIDYTRINHYRDLIQDKYDMQFTIVRTEDQDRIADLW